MDVPTDRSNVKRPRVAQPGRTALTSRSGADGQLTRERVGEALGEWQAKEVRIAHGFAECKGLSIEQLEDIYQETAVALLGRRFHREEHLRNALAEGIKHRALNLYRDERRREEILTHSGGGLHVMAHVSEDQHSPERVALIHQDRAIVSEFLTELSALEQRVFWLIAEGMKYRGIAAVLGIQSNDAHNAARACERKRERFQLLYDTGRLCGFRAATIQALQSGESTSEQLAVRAFAHLDACAHCRAEHRTNAKRLQRSFGDQTAILLPPVLIHRLGWLARLALRARRLTGGLTRQSTAAQAAVHQRLATLLTGGGIKITTVIATVAAVTGGAVGTTHVLKHPAVHPNHSVAPYEQPARLAEARTTRTIRPAAARTPLPTTQRTARRSHHVTAITHNATRQTAHPQGTHVVTATRHETRTGAHEEKAAVEFGPERTPA
jgi:RNA polymerase sigma factor (sigma-70 family)